MVDNSHAPGPRGRVGRSPTVLLVVIMAALSGCTSPARFTPASGSGDFPPYKGEVRVLENLPPSGQYKRVGVIIIEGVLLTKEASMVTAIKKQAAANGADAVVMQSKIKVTKDPDGSTRKRLGAWAIRLNR
jgi:type IV pilus biogenesis protein CpaD/CtpE